MIFWLAAALAPAAPALLGQVTGAINGTVRDSSGAVFNHANLRVPGNSAIGNSFGVINTAASPRIGQLALKLIF
ncbi:MAG: hypothetical protein ACE15B_07525 [Bryobacteraceae bacterium]